MTNIELSIEKINEVVQRQNGLCAISGKKFDQINDEVKVFALSPDTEQLDNLVAVWVNADLSNLKKRKRIYSTN